MRLQQLTQRVRLNEVRTTAQDHREQPEHGKRHDVLPPDLAPERFEHCYAPAVRLSGEIRCVDRACGGAHHAARMLTAFEQFAQHANLDRAKAATASEHESGQTRKMGVHGLFETSARGQRQLLVPVAPAAAC